MAPIISREEIAQVLKRWGAGDWDAEQVHTWAQERYGQVEFDDWEDDDTNSVANEVLAALDMLDMNLMLIEDVPIYLAFLRTLPGQFGEGYRAFQDALHRIDYQARKQALHTHPLYARFCE